MQKMAGKSFTGQVGRTVLLTKATLNKDEFADLR